MKFLGWIFILLGSNGLTGALVARNSIRYDPSSVAYDIVGHVVEIIGAEGILNTLMMLAMDRLTDSLAEILGPDQEFVQLVDMLFNISVGVLAIGIVLLAIGYIRGAKAKVQPQLIQQAGHQVSSAKPVCISCSTPTSGNFCPICGQKVVQI